MEAGETPHDDPAKGGKRGQSRLPKDWRLKLFETVRGRKQTKPTKLPEAVAMLWVTGCRPSELQAGVQYTTKLGMLLVQIKGAKHGELLVQTKRNEDGTVNSEKVSAMRGMASRTIAVDPDLHPGARYLYDLALGEKLPRTLSYNKNSIRSRINEAGREVLAKLKDAPTLSPYSFRHAMASDLKSCDDLTDEQRAQVMGHLSVESLESYGRRRRGGGGVSPVVKVQTSAEPHGKLTHAPRVKTGPKKRP